MTVKEGYRNYDSPVAMPGEFVEVPKGLTLEEYFAGLDKQFGLPEKDVEVESTGKSVKLQQVAGDHYQRGIQPWDIISEWGLGFWRGNVLKYLLRAPFKAGKEDLMKARHYLDYLIENYDDIKSKDLF
jgi:hypothetical protein